MYLSIGVNIPSWVSWAPLHAPDGFFSLPLAIAGYVVVALVIAFAARQTNRELSERMVPMMGVMGAFIFAAQMINFPVAGGTSGHLVGGALAAIILGPWAAILVMTAVVGLQALLFQDGGLVVLGINLFNMSIVSVLAGYGVYSAVGLVKASSKTTLAVGGFVGAWVSVMAAAVLVAFQLAVSGTSPLQLALPVLAGVHALIGIGEGLITVFALSFILAARPELLRVRRGADPDPAPASGRGIGFRRVLIVGYLIAVGVTLLAPLASGSPDGLERIAEDQGFIETALDAPYAIIGDYAVPGIENEAVATILAGLIGVTVVYVLFAGFAYLVYRATANRGRARADQFPPPAS